MSTRPNHNSQNRKGRSDYNYLCGMRYRHLIPPPTDPPFDLVWKADTERVMTVKRTTRTFQTTRLPLLSDGDLGMPYDLSVVSNAFYGDDSVLNPRKYSGLDSKDVALLVPAKPAINVIPGLAQLKRHSNDPKTWLRRTQYISASESVYKSDNSATTMESRMATLKATNDLLNRTHEEQIAAIEYSFEAANDPKRLKKLEHHKNSKITPVEILPILPDFEMRNRILAHCCFDSDPWEGVPMDEDDDRGEMRQDRATKALVNPMASGNDRFLMLYVPSAESAERLKNKRTFEECKDESFQYKWVRDYNIENQVLPKNSQILFYEKYDDITKERRILYSPFSVRTTLRRRRQTERIRVPENYGKTTYLESSYTAPDYEESFWDRYRSDRLHEHEIVQLMRKRHKGESKQGVESDQDYHEKRLEDVHEDVHSLNDNAQVDIDDGAESDHTIT